MMIIYHFAWDLDYYKLVEIDLMSPAWKAFPRGIASTFLIVMGISLTLSYNRAMERTGRTGLFAKYLVRGGKVFGLGLVITAATYLFIGQQGFVVFGILHLIGLSIVLAYPFLGWSRWVSLGIGLLIIGIGVFYVSNLVVTYPWLLPLGVKQAGRYMVDYYPLLPWFGVALLGVFAGFTAYPKGQPRFSLPDGSALFPPIRGLRFMGRHALLIYMIHQPILQGLLLLGVNLGVTS